MYKSCMCHNCYLIISCFGFINPLYILGLCNSDHVPKSPEGENLSGLFWSRIFIGRVPFLSANQQHQSVEE